MMREVIADALVSVCSDGNSDPLRVADAVLRALYAVGYSVVPDGPGEWQSRLLARLAGLGLNELRVEAGVWVIRQGANTWKFTHRMQVDAWLEEQERA